MENNALVSYINGWG